MYTRKCFSPMAILALAALGSAQGSDNVDVKTVVKVLLGKDACGYSATYDYDFPQQSAVFIKGVGIVPRKGSLSYLCLCKDSRLEIRDPSTGGLLFQKDLQVTLSPAAPPPLNTIPSETEFPAQFQSFAWQSQKSLMERSNAVLNKYFRYFPREDGGKTYLITTFTPLPLQNPSAGTTGRLALLLSFPYSATAKGYDFHIQSLVKEGRDLSDDLRPPTDQRVVTAADEFVRKLIEQLNQ